MKTMPKSTKEEKYRWIRPIIEGDITIKAMTKACPFSERSLKYWIALYKKHGIEGLSNKSRRPKSHPRETPIRIKEYILDKRKQTKKCALKLKWELRNEGITIHHRTIGKILKSEGLTRKYKVRRIKYKYIRAHLQPGELIEIDVKYVPQKLDGMRYYQYTAIDVASRWRHLAIYPEQSNLSSLRFIKEVMRKFPYPIHALKTDNHSTFTNRAVGYPKSTDPINARLHPLDIFCIDNNIAHYLIDKGKPAQNGTVERSHRSDQEIFYDQVKFKNPAELLCRARLWNMYYNDLEHCGLNGLTPNQALGIQRVQNVRA